MIYRHKKGGFYLAIIKATDEWTLCKKMIYMSLNLSTFGKTWDRNLDEFEEKDRFVPIIIFVLKRLKRINQKFMRSQG